MKPPIKAPFRAPTPGVINTLASILGDEDPVYTHVELHQRYCDASGQGDAFQDNGCLYHNLWWSCVDPEGGQQPSRAACAAAGDSLPRSLQVKLYDACMGVRGSGWGAISKERATGRLLVHQLRDHEPPPFGFVPVLLVDVWEHAYPTMLLDRSDYVFNLVMHNLNWSLIDRALESR